MHMPLADAAICKHANYQKPTIVLSLWLDAMIISLWL
jgi:hypothetical protein